MSHFTLDCYCPDWYMYVTTNELLQRMVYYNYWIVTVVITVLTGLLHCFIVISLFGCYLTFIP